MGIESASEISEGLEILPHGSVKVEILAAEDEALKKLKLSKFSFKVHTKEPLNEEIDLPELVKDKERNIYFLLHGWTGTHEIFDIKGYSMVEQILEKDPNAVIICPDGNGFGDTEFEEDLSLNELSEVCTPGDYADQFNFLQETFGINDEENKRRTFLMGHSMGGAATLMAAAKGYVPPENCIALNPALLTKSKEEVKDSTKIIRIIYGGLGKSFNFGSHTNEIDKLERLTDEVIERAFKGLMGPELMGENKHADLDKKQVVSIFKSLMKIHGKQMVGKKIGITSAAMEALADGVEASKDDVEKMLEVETITGQDDKLAPRREGLLSSYEQIVGRKITNKETVMIREVPNSGHYASVYSGKGNRPVNRLISRGLRRLESLRNPDVEKKQRNERRKKLLSSN